MNNKKYLRTYRWIVYILVILIVVITVYNITNPRRESFQVVSLLVPDTTRFVKIEDQQKRINYLSKIALQHQSDNAQDQTTRGIERMQTRLAFIALFAVLLISFLRTKKIMGRFVITMITLSLSMSIYFYDIHTVDLNLRQTYNKGCIDITILTLSKITLSDSTWYNFDYKKTQEFDSSKHTDSFLRKLSYSIRPDLSQISFYFLPVTIMLVLYLFYPITKKKVSIGRKNRNANYSSPWRRRGI